MKITVNKKIDPYLLKPHIIKEYEYLIDVGGSEDGYRRGHASTVYCEVIGIIENEVQNPDGTYTYDYSIREKERGYRPLSEIMKLPKAPDDYKEMIDGLLFEYDIHEFKTDLQEEPISIKDYYISLFTTGRYKKGEEPTWGYQWETNTKNSEEYTGENTDNLEKSSWIQEFKTDSLDELNEQLKNTLNQEDYSLYLLGVKAEKKYSIILGLDDIKEDEGIRDFMRRIQYPKPKYSTLEEALKDNCISIEDIKNSIKECRNLNAKGISNELLEQLFNEDKELLSYFYEGSVPANILRKYKPNFNIANVLPSDLLPSDLDNLLQNVIKSHGIFGIYNGPSEKEMEQGYWKYLQEFIDNKEALTKIIPVINTARDFRIREHSPEFISQISPETLSKAEIRDLLLEAEDISLYQILKYDFDYDLGSARKLNDALSNAPKPFISEVNEIIKILKANGISDDEIVKALRKNEFDIGMSGMKENKKYVSTFKNFKIDGITLEDVQKSILKDKNFDYLELVSDIDSEELTREYVKLLNKLAVKNGKQIVVDNNNYRDGVNETRKQSETENNEQQNKVGKTGDNNKDDKQNEIKNNEQQNKVGKTGDINKNDKQNEIKNNEQQNKVGKTGDNNKDDKQNEDGKKRYEEIFELMCDYSNAAKLFSKLTTDVKELTKKLMIDKLDEIERLRKDPVGYTSDFSKMMKVMINSFNISEDDMIKTYMKCLNNGAKKEEILEALCRYIPEEKRDGFVKRIDSANIYPNPKYFWLTDKNLKRISKSHKDTRDSIKKKIQADSRCFTTKIMTDMVGESKEGTKIKVNNLSKWLFGVPGARGHLAITRAGDYIQLPSNTPDEAVKLIEEVLNEKTRE